MNKPHLTFFCELEAEPLNKLFDSRFVMDDLKSLNAKLSLGILDLSAERAQVVKKLNRLKVPVIAWLLLPKEEGYWFNADNYAAATKFYDDFSLWTKENDLSWAGIGLDIEPDINSLKQLKSQKWRIVGELFKRLRDRQKMEAAHCAYQQLVDQIHSDGYATEIYHIPLIVDERKARSNVLQRLGGLVDLTVDTEVLMLYSSFLRPHGEKFLWQYAQDADAIGIGNTGGGVDLGEINQIPPLTWEEFSRDLRLAYSTGKPIHILCLEGCVAQGYLERLITFRWEDNPKKPNAFYVAAGRKGFQTLLWLLQRPWVILISFVSILAGILVTRKKKR